MEFVNPPMEHISRSNPNMESSQKLFARNARAVYSKKDLTEAKLVAAGLPAGTAHRGIVPDGHNMTLAVLDKWGRALKTAPWLLLHPEFDIEKPLIVTSEAKIEAEVDRRLKERLLPLSELIGGLSDTEKPRPDGRSVAKPFPDLETTERQSAIEHAARPSNDRRKKVKGQ